VQEFYTLPVDKPTNLCQKFKIKKQFIDIVGLSTGTARVKANFSAPETSANNTQDCWPIFILYQLLHTDTKQLLWTGA